MFNKLKLVRRKITLSPRFWKETFGPILAFKKEENTPVALLMENGKYFLYDPKLGGQKQKLSTGLAESLMPGAWLFYETLPQKVSSFSKLLFDALSKNKEDWYKLLGVTLFISLIGLFIPCAQAILVNHILPEDRYSPLMWLVSLLLVSAIVAAAGSLSQNFIELRLLGKYTYSFQAALFERLLKLPSRFFKSYRAADLTMRALGINALNQLFSTASFNALIALPFSMVLLLLITCLSPLLGLLTFCFVIFFVAFSLLWAFLVLRETRKATKLQGQVSAQLFQFLIGIATLHTTGSESRAFNLFAKQYALQAKAFYRAGVLSCVLETFYLSFPILSFLALYVVSAKLFLLDTHFNLGKFVAINAAFGSLIGILQVFAQTLLSLPSLIPLIERIKPILKEPPEYDSIQFDSDDLQGKIEARGLSFRYTEQSPWIFQNLNFEAKQGEFIAIVGPSGMGKSTLLRLLLGFEKPTAGNIFYDDKDLAGLNIAAIRRQMGVVIQSSQLLRGDVFSNITGGLNYTEQDAWHAAEKVGLVADIESLPMGMFTYIGENGVNLSGGQRQLLILARALIRNPKIILLDEATNQLDNQSQAFVTKTLDKMAVTRIVVAHRLSTIKKADRIFVLKDGTFTESGSFNELLAQQGDFSHLVGQDLS